MSRIILWECCNSPHKQETTRQKEAEQRHAVEARESMMVKDKTTQRVCVHSKKTCYQDIEGGAGRQIKMFLVAVTNKTIKQCLRGGNGRKD